MPVLVTILVTVVLALLPVSNTIAKNSGERWQSFCHPERVSVLSISDREGRQGMMEEMMRAEEEDVLDDFDDEEFFDNEGFEDDDFVAEERFDARLRGKEEVPRVDSDGDGTGEFVLIGNDLFYDITVEDLSGPVISAHFHRGQEGVAGPVLQPIAFDGTTARGAWMDLTGEQLMLLEDEMIYVNVHTAQHPGGEIRGQVD